MNARTQHALVQVILELRPDLPVVIAQSLICEALDRADEVPADQLDPDRRWYDLRQALYPAAVAEVRRAHDRMRKQAVPAPRVGGEQ